MGKSLATLGGGIKPTFARPVRLKAGGLDQVVRFTFKTRGRDELEAFAKRSAEMTDEQALAEVLVGWELDDEFGPESIARLCQAVPIAGVTIVRAYIDAFYGRN